MPCLSVCHLIVALSKNGCIFISLQLKILIKTDTYSGTFWRLIRAVILHEGANKHVFISLNSNAVIKLLKKKLIKFNKT
jgi:hypothetical protein